VLYLEDRERESVSRQMQSGPWLAVRDGSDGFFVEGRALPPHLRLMRRERDCRKEIMLARTVSCFCFGLVS